MATLSNAQTTTLSGGELFVFVELAESNTASSATITADVGKSFKPNLDIVLILQKMAIRIIFN